MADRYGLRGMMAAASGARVLILSRHREPQGTAPRRALEDRAVTLGYSWPCHRPAFRIGALAHCESPGLVAQQPRDLATECRDIAKGYEHAPAISQELARMPRGCRDHCFAQPEAVGHAAGCQLRLVQVRRRIDIAHRDETQQRRLIHELIQKDDMVFDSKRAHTRDQAAAIGFALIADEVRMRRSEHDVDGCRAALEDFGHRVDHHFDSLAGGEQPESQNDRMPIKAKGALRLVRLDERAIGRSVRDDLYLCGHHLIDGAQQLPALFGHDNEAGGCIDDVAKDAALRGCRLREHGMERGYERHGEPGKKGHDVAAGLATEDAEFVLQRDDLAPCPIQDIGRTLIIPEPAVIDLQTDSRRVVIGTAVVVHRDYAALLIRRRSRDGLLQISREGGNTTAARERIPDERKSPERPHGAAFPAVAELTDRARGRKCAGCEPRAGSLTRVPFGRRRRSGAGLEPTYAISPSRPSGPASMRARSASRKTAIPAETSMEPTRPPPARVNSHVSPVASRSLRQPSASARRSSTNRGPPTSRVLKAVSLRGGAWRSR